MRASRRAQWIEARPRAQRRLYGGSTECCAEDYDKATREQAWCHQQLSIAHGLIGKVVDDGIWNRYLVPASSHLATLRKVAREEWSVPIIMSADRLSLSEQASRQKLVRAGEKLFSNWPL